MYHFVVSLTCFWPACASILLMVQKHKNRLHNTCSHLFTDIYRVSADSMIPGSFGGWPWCTRAIWAPSSGCTSYLDHCLLLISFLYHINARCCNQPLSLLMRKNYQLASLSLLLRKNYHPAFLSLWEITSYFSIELSNKPIVSPKNLILFDSNSMTSMQ